MTCLDISSVRDFNKIRLRKMLIDFFFYTTNPFGPPDPNRIELDSGCEKLIELTNRNLFKDFDGKEHLHFANEAYEKPKAFIYVKLLNTGKFTKKVGDYLIEFRIIKRKQTKRKNAIQIGKNTTKIKSKNEFKRLKVNQVLFKPSKVPKDQIKVSKLGADRLRMLERKFRYGFSSKTPELARKSLKDVFNHHKTSSSMISKTSCVLYQAPPNWNYCKIYELALNRTLDPSNLFVEIDVRLIEFFDINPKQAKIIKTLPLSDLLEDQFLDVVIIKDLKKFYLQTIETINHREDQFPLNKPVISLNNYIMKSSDSAQASSDSAQASIQQNEFSESKSTTKVLDSKENTIGSTVSEERHVNKKAIRTSLLDRLFQNSLFQNRFRSYKENHLKRNEMKNDARSSSDVKSDVKWDKKSDQKINFKDDEKANDKANTRSHSYSSIKANKRKLFGPFFNIFKPIQSAKKKKSTKGKSRKVKKRKFENAAFLSIELQLGKHI